VWWCYAGGPTARTCAHARPSTTLMRADAAADVGVVTPVLRIPPTPALTRRLALLLVALGLLLAAFEAPPAGAVVTEVETAKVGLQPTEMSRYWEAGLKWDGYNGERPKLPNPVANPSVASFGNPEGNAVMHSVKTYAIYWDPSDYYHGDWQGLIDGFLGNAAKASGQINSVFAVDGQYTDATNRPAANGSAFLGAYTDTNAYPRPACVNPQPFEFGAPLAEAENACLTDGQIKEQLEDFVAGHGLQEGMSTIFYVLTPPGVAVCLDAGGEAGHCSAEFPAPAEKAKLPRPLTFWEEIEEDEATKVEKEENEEVYVEPTSYKRYKQSFCSYHDAIGDGNEETILYAVIPWTAGDDGDNHLAPTNIPGYFCQDGGFKPDTKANGEIEEKEYVKPPTPKEQEEFEQKNSEEKRKQKEAEELGLQGPHDQEPNQLGSTRSVDGGYDEGLADLIINQIAIEQQDVVTDPLLDAWHDSAGNEVTDECRNFFAPTIGSASANPATRAGSLSNQVFDSRGYYLNDVFDLSAAKLTYPGVPCRNNISVEPLFTAPVLANVGEIVGFDGMESNITLNAGTEYVKGEAKNTYARYTWNFGDGSAEVSGYAPGAPPGNPSSLCELPWLPPCAASEFHAYKYGGTYNVTLSVKDVAGDTASVTHPITVIGPPAPTPPAPPAVSPGSSSAAGTGSTSNSASTSKVTPAVPPPVALAAAVSTSLAQVARSGLVVHYSVNEQVAGRFEVLLAAALAHRLGISGPLATDLPAGSPRSLVIGRALLVTTKGGHSSVKIKFSKSVAKRLRRARNVKLTLRLTAHNASAQDPLFTTVMSSVELHR
jgi:hypothetical protein